MTIHVVGGVYLEYCTRPSWNHLYGSAGRASIALGRMQTPVVLHSYFTQGGLEQFRTESAWYQDVRVCETIIPKGLTFRYLHDLATPEIFNRPSMLHAQLVVNEEKVVRFGMLDGDAIVNADWAVYDPQNMGSAISFKGNGSTATHLALVLNTWEAQSMVNAFGTSPENCAQLIASQEGAEVVVIKMGPRGALVWSGGKGIVVPAFRTSNVWKIGSGDCFVAHFANEWMHEGRSPGDAAESASRATAYYCERKMLPTQAELAKFSPPSVQVSQAYIEGAQRQVYLAGPFFDLAQVWLIEEARRYLQDMRLKVLSPFHDIGLGSASDVVQQDLDGIRDSDLLFAVADGLDAGTIYEIGYARAKGKPVVVYSERESEESLKMMEGSGCVICTNFTTAVYSTLWEAAKL
jgi:nucleoside 2-deoxyribosyltransferase